MRGSSLAPARGAAGRAATGRPGTEPGPEGRGRRARAAAVAALIVSSSCLPRRCVIETLRSHQSPLEDHSRVVPGVHDTDGVGQRPHPQHRPAKIPISLGGAPSTSVLPRNDRASAGSCPGRGIRVLARVVAGLASSAAATCNHPLDLQSLRFRSSLADSLTARAGAHPRRLPVPARSSRCRRPRRSEGERGRRRPRCLASTAPPRVPAPRAVPARERPQRGLPD